jgi:hypothetical protein
MTKLLKLLGVLAVVTSSIGYASAATVQEDFVFSYSSNGSFTLSDLTYASTSTPNTNLLTLFPYTTATGGGLSGSGKLSEVISVDTGTSYFSNYAITNATGNTQSFSISVSPVPLPAGFPLFVMALLGLGLFGYHTARSAQSNTRVAAGG